jgi:predicted O-methyltransferase YrrM
MPHRDDPFLKKIKVGLVALNVGMIILCLVAGSFAQKPSQASDSDARVSRFLIEARGSWSDWNIPYEDGKILYNQVLKGDFRNILEIGTSTGHSTIWLAWAASKTGGRVTTIEIDRGRYETALANFRKAGVAPYIEARLADAHQFVPLRKGPFDFVFCDADKDWYLRYFLDLKGKIAPKGCFSAHNVLWGSDPHISKFLEYLKRDPEFRTTIERGSAEGISISCRVEK